MKTKSSKSVRKIIAVSLVLTLIITFATPWFLEGRTGGSNGYISLAFDGIGKGFDPKGNHFDINEIKSDEVLEKAIKAAGMQNDYTTEQLRQMIVIKPLAGKNILSEFTKMSATSEKTKAVLEKSVNTGNYKITVKEIGLIPNPMKNLKLCEAVMKEYKKNFKKSYLVDSTVSSAYKKEDIFALDYPEMMLVMKQDAAALVRYIDAFVKASPDFVSEKTGLTFADIKLQAEVISEKEIGSAANIVDYYVLTKAGSNRIAYENIKMKRAKLTQKKRDGVVSRIGYILNSYDNTSNYIMTSDNPSDLAGNQENKFYSDLMDQLVLSKNAAINAKYSVAEIQKHIDKLSETNETVDKVALAKSIEKDAKEAYTRMEKLRKQVKVLAEENYDLNIGSKIDISNTSYHVNTWGNVFVNFILILILVSIVSSIFRFIKSKDKGYFKNIIKLSIRKWLKIGIKN